MPSTKLLALGVLLAAGFPAGFCLSSGSAHYFAPDVIRAQPGGKGYHGAGSGGGAGGGGGGGAEHGGGSEAVAGGDQGGGGGDDRPAGAGSAQQAEAKPRPAPSAPSEADALRTLLAGNTLRNDRDRDAAERYLSRLGWQGIGDRTTAVVRRWSVLNDQLCITGIDQTLSCETLTMAREAKPGLDLGDVLGTVTAASGARYTVLRGNVAHLPEMVPLIDGRAPVAIARQGPPASTGSTALKALIGHSAADATEGHNGLSGFHFSKDGAWITARPLVPVAHTGAGGVRVIVGRWAVHGDTLCLDQPGLDLNRTCYRAQQWAGGAIRLTPTQAGGSMDLSVLPDGA